MHGTLICYVDIKLDNLMFQFEDVDVFAHSEKQEQHDSAQRKDVGSERSVYRSRPIGGPQEDTIIGPVVLSDLGEARIGTSFSWIPVQPAVYRAPEVLLHSKLGHSLDMWNLACAVSPPMLLVVKILLTR